MQARIVEKVVNPPQTALEAFERDDGAEYDEGEPERWVGHQLREFLAPRKRLMIPMARW